MALRRRERAAWATGLSLVLHVLFLAGMVLGLKVDEPPPEGRAMEVRLIPPPQARSRPKPPRPTQNAQRAAAPAPLRPHLTPAPPAAVSTTPLPETSAQAAPPKVLYGPSGLQPSVSGRLGCDDPLGIHMTPEQRQACANNMAALGRAAKPLGLDISARKQADYDRKVHCQDVYKRGGMPSFNSLDASTGGQINGLGYNPSLKECPPGDR